MSLGILGESILIFYYKTQQVNKTDYLIQVKKNRDISFIGKFILYLL